MHENAVTFVNEWNTPNSTNRYIQRLVETIGMMVEKSGTSFRKVNSNVTVDVVTRKRTAVLDCVNSYGFRETLCLLFPVVKISQQKTSHKHEPLRD